MQRPFDKKNPAAKETAENAQNSTSAEETENIASPDEHNEPEITENDPSENANVADSSKSDDAQPSELPRAAKRRSKFTGAYWFCDKDAEELKKQSFIRTMLSVIAALLQLVVLLLPQNGIGYITEKLPSYAFVYMCTVFVMIAVAVFVIIMNFHRYRLMKRIPKEYAPRNGFKHRSFFGAEAYVAITAVLFIMEISFVCLSYDGFGLLGVFLTALSTAAAAWARMITVIALKDAIYVPAIGEEIPVAESEDPDEKQK